jgi:hypothetical protein
MKKGIWATHGGGKGEGDEQDQFYVLMYEYVYRSGIPRRTRQPIVHRNVQRFFSHFFFGGVFSTPPNLFASAPAPVFLEFRLRSRVSL